MASVFSEDLRIQNAENFKDLITRQLSNTKVYFTFGKSIAWPDDNNPPQANTSVTALNEVWTNMIGAKLLTGNEVRQVIVRKNWANNSVYHAYDHCTCSLILFDANTNFYVMTPDWNVYKCLANNNGSLSTVMPTQIYTDKAIEETDGYIWKYMYTVPVAERSRFVTANYIPVRTLEETDGSLQWSVQQNAVAGALEAIRMTNFGSGYFNANTVSVTITGNGSGAEAIPRITSPTSNITFSTGAGTTVTTLNLSALAANSNVMLSNGATINVNNTISKITLYVPSSNQITINPGVSGNLTANTITLVNAITSIVTTLKGSGYTYANVTISDSNTTPGINATARAIISPTGGHGSDPVHELGASYVILNPRLETSENNKFPVTNDYRQVSLISNPRLSSNSQIVASNIAYSQFTSAVFDFSTAQYQQDEIVYQGTSLSGATFTGRVLNWDFTGNTMFITNTTGTLSVGQILIGDTSKTEKFVQSVRLNELKPYTGQLLYIDNTKPITRAADQIEDFKIVMKF